jgi:hypothetical protein
MFVSLRRHSGTIVVAAIVGAVAAGSPAVAAEVVSFAKSAGNANTVNKIGASKTPRAGMLVPLNAKGKFPAGVIPASAQAIGKVGPQGPQGLQGAQGLAGPAGAQGPNGNTGATGADGANGLPGAAGATGSAGPTGPAGTDGAVGPTGLTGATGSAGPIGPTGADGPAGPAGPTGAAGPAGADGAAGPAGPTGATGPAGDDGATGPAGPAGPAGPTGPQGPQGVAGGLVYPELVDINPIPAATDSDKWNDIIINGNSFNNGYRSSHDGGDNTSFIKWRVPLAAGTWTLQVMYTKGDNAGIMNFYLDDDVTPIGTVDGYSSTIEFNQRSMISGITVGDSGMHTIRVRTDAKNAASSNYFGYLVWLRLVKQ